MAEPSIPGEPIGITPLESGVMGLLLEGDDPTREVLRQQFASAILVRREYTGVGFFTYFSADSQAPRIADKTRTRLENVGAQIPPLKHGAGFILWIEQGAISVLEGYTFDGPWPDNIIDFTLSR